MRPLDDDAADFDALEPPWPNWLDHVDGLQDVPAADPADRRSPTIRS